MQIFVVNGTESCLLRLSRLLDLVDFGCWISLILLLPAGSAAGSSVGISFTRGPILGFYAPQGRHVAPIKVKFDREERTVGTLLPAKFDLDRFRGGGLRPPKLKKIRIFPIYMPLRGGSLARFLQNLQDICASSVSIILLNLAALFR